MTSQSPRQRLLVVEDEPLVAMMLEDVLGEAGYVVVGPIAHLDAAVAAAQAEAVDLALLDVNLMGKHVYPAAAALADRGIPFVFMTGYGDGSLPADFAGRPSVSKPYKVKTLLDALAALSPKQHDTG
jgi:CheY-like chemotaxis protein